MPHRLTFFRQVALNAKSVVADGHTASNTPDLFRSVLGWGTAREDLRVLSAFAACSKKQRIGMLTSTTMIGKWRWDQSHGSSSGRAVYKARGRGVVQRVALHWFRRDPANGGYPFGQNVAVIEFHLRQGGDSVVGSA